MKADSQGKYQLWFNHGCSPLEVIAAEDGYTALQQYLSAHERLRTG